MAVGTGFAMRRVMMRQLAWILLGAAACTRGPTPVTVDAPGLVPDSLYLDVKNIGGHCSVTINDAGPYTSAEETLADYAPGQTILLFAWASAGFTLGRWHDTAHDSGSGDPESSTSVTLGDSPGCVWICCSSTPGDCPTTDQCL